MKYLVEHMVVSLCMWLRCNTALLEQERSDAASTDSAAFVECEQRELAEPTAVVVAYLCTVLQRATYDKHVMITKPIEIHLECTLAYVRFARTTCLHSQF